MTLEEIEDLMIIRGYDQERIDSILKAVEELGDILREEDDWEEGDVLAYVHPSPETQDPMGPPPAPPV